MYVDQHDDESPRFVAARKPEDSDIQLVEASFSQRLSMGIQLSGP